LSDEDDLLMIVAFLKQFLFSWLAHMTARNRSRFWGHWIQNGTRRSPFETLLTRIWVVGNWKSLFGTVIDICRINSWVKLSSILQVVTVVKSCHF